MKTYKIKPYEVEAIQWKGDNIEEIHCFADGIGDIFTFVCGKLYLNSWHNLKLVYKTDYVVFRVDTGKIGVYSEEHFNRKFMEVL